MKTIAALGVLVGLGGTLRLVADSVSVTNSSGAGLRIAPHDGGANMEALQFSPAGNNKYGFLSVHANGAPTGGEVGFATVATGKIGSADYEAIELLYAASGDAYRLFITGDGLGLPRTFEIRSEDDINGGQLLTAWHYLGGADWRIDHYRPQRMYTTEDVGTAPAPSRTMEWQCHSYDGVSGRNPVVKMRAMGGVGAGEHPYELQILDDDDNVIHRFGVAGDQSSVFGGPIDLSEIDPSVAGLRMTSTADVVPDVSAPTGWVKIEVDGSPAYLPYFRAP